MSLIWYNIFKGGNALVSQSENIDEIRIIDETNPCIKPKLTAPNDLDLKGGHFKLTNEVLSCTSMAFKASDMIFCLLGVARVNKDSLLKPVLLCGSAACEGRVDLRFAGSTSVAPSRNTRYNSSSSTSISSTLALASFCALVARMSWTIKLASCERMRICVPIKPNKRESSTDRIKVNMSEIRTCDSGVPVRRVGFGKIMSRSFVSTMPRLRLPAESEMDTMSTTPEYTIFSSCEGSGKVYTG